MLLFSYIPTTSHRNRADDVGLVVDNGDHDCD